MELSCPVSKDMVNEKVVRINALFIFIILVLAWLTPYKWLILYLTLDFGIKVFYKLNMSPIAILSRYIFKLFGGKPKMINAGPKKFAAKTGLVLCLVIIALELLNVHFAAIIVMSVLILFVSLECFVGFCAACYIYSFLNKFKKQAH